ncbi:ARMC6 [Symbiodinium sp. CCMP2592]|nr:ARMC6 [Symbiodinium sp. CCMP2592]
MFGRLFKKRDPNEPQVHKVKLPDAPSAMYFDKEKGRWRERGKEHLEEEETALPPPPSMGSSAATPPEKKEEKKEASALDNMIAPPNPYGNRFGGARKHTAPASVMRPMQVPFGEPPPPVDAGATDEPAETSAPAAAAAPPPASEGFGAPVAAPMNPFAPRSVTGGSVNPHAPKGFRESARRQEKSKEKKQPPAKVSARASPFATSPFGQAPAPIADPEGDPEGAGEGKPPALGEQGEEDHAPPAAVPPSPLRASLPAYSPFAQPQIPRGYGGREEEAVLPEPAPTTEAVPDGEFQEAAVPAVAATAEAQSVRAVPDAEFQEAAMPEIAATAQAVPDEEFQEAAVPEVAATAEAVPDAEFQEAPVPEVAATAEAEPGEILEEAAVPEVAATAEAIPDAEFQEAAVPEIAATAEAVPDAEFQETTVPEVAATAEAEPVEILEAVPDDELQEAAVPEVAASAEAEPVEILEERAGTSSEAQAQLEELSAKLQQADGRAAQAEAQSKELSAKLQQADGRAAHAEAQLELLSTKLQQDRMWVMSWALGLWSGEVQAQLAELSSKLQQDRDLGDFMCIGAVAQLAELSSKLQQDRDLGDFMCIGAVAQLAELSSKLQQADGRAAQTEAQLQELSTKLQQGNVPAESSEAGTSIAVLMRPDPREESVREALVFAGENCEGKHIDSLIALLGKHISNLAVCSQVCATLENLTFTDVDNQSRIVDLGGIELILKVLETHEDADGAQLRPVVDSLWNLTFNVKAVERATATGGVRRVASVLAKNLATPDVLGGVCAVLLNLAVLDENRHQIVQCGGAESMVQAIKAHQGREEVVEHACQALYLLAYHTELRPSVVAANAAEAAALATTCGGPRAPRWGRILEEVLAC